MDEASGHFYQMGQITGAVRSGWAGSDGMTGTYRTANNYAPDIKEEYDMMTLDQEVMDEPSVPVYRETRDTFQNARDALGRVRELSGKVALLRRRIAFREDLAGKDVGCDLIPAEQLGDELEQAKRDLRIAVIQVTDLIGRLPDVSLQMVLTKRYVDGMSWESIADDMDIGIRAVQKMHGRALPVLERMLSRKEM